MPITNTQSPRELGYVMPAEWEPHQATWLSWPHKEASWPGKIDKILPVFAQMVAALARSETVHINVNHRAMEEHARKLLDDAGARGDIRFYEFPTNDAWCRDHGAIFVRRDRSPTKAFQSPWGGTQESSENSNENLAAIDWGYNAWGGKYPPFDLDNQIPAYMSSVLGTLLFDGEMILEGGSIDVNGQGLLLTTESCLLNPNRNPDMTRAQIEKRIIDMLGVQKILWLGDGIVGDDTDGHIDDITRFVAPLTVVTAIEDDSSDENFEPLQANLERLKEMRSLDGRAFEIIPIPMPPPLVYEGQRLPASYANFYIANTVVLVPFYNSPRDAQVAGILQDLFPSREIVGIDCTDLVWGLGAFHCLTQQVPAG